MSYILEALRRAETERERKRRVPGLHTQPVPVVPAEEPGERRSKAWLWVVVGVSAGVLLPLAWRWGAADPDAEAAGSARTAVAGSVAQPGGVAAADAPAALVAAPAPEPSTNQPAAPVAPAAQERPQAPQAAPTTAKAAAAKPAAAGTQPAPAMRQPTAAATNPIAAGTATSQGTISAPAAAAAPTAAAARASAPEPRLRSLAELPEELRRGVPALAFGGSVYSETAAQRMVIFNGQVLREGDAVTDELQLEQIRPHSAVMRLRGQRFEITF